MLHIRRSILLLVIVFILPALTHLAFWLYSDRPRNWSEADWSSAGTLPDPEARSSEVILMVARTGGLKGAFASHSWLLIKKPGATHYDRYDVVGWGSPVRINNYPPDGRWYSNTPIVHARATGAVAEIAIPKLEAAIRNYRFKRRGDYTIWPGPNSNTFVASVINAAPELGWQMPATAIGRDYPVSNAWFSRNAGGDLLVSIGGYLGVRWNMSRGIEFHFLGLVAGIDWQRMVLKLPGFGALDRFI